MTRKLITAAALLLTVHTAMAQELTPGQNYMNKFATAPAFAGFNGNDEGFLGYRASMTGIEGAPTMLRANVNGNIKGNMGYGVDIINEKSGNFSNTIAALTYAYHVRLNSDANLSFALSPTIVRSAFDLSNAKTYSAAVDPVFQNEAGLAGTGFDAGFSIMFNIKGLYFSVNAPRLICQDLKFQNGIVNTDREINTNISYAIEADKWEIEPGAMVSYGLKNGLDWQASLVAKYDRRAWLQASYSSQQWVGVGVGFAATNRIVMCYQYEIGMSDIAKTCNGNHEVTVGFLIGKAKKYQKPTIFIDDKTDARGNGKGDGDLAKKLQEEIKTRDEEIKRLEGLIDDCCTNNNPTSDVNTPKPSEDPVQITDPSEPNQQVADNNQPVEENEIAQPRDPHSVEWLTPSELINVRFATGTATLLQSSKSDLDALALKVRHDKNKDRDILIIAYTNDPTAYGKQMSENRAMTIKKYLISKGVPAQRLIATGARLRTVSDDPDGRYEDNRVMIGLEAKPRDK
ncbi:MAG: PorP/SprF family type IX secretion system membrane protein [Bacteroidales bacterium]|nr:PorP/SprF family type IX secretion system membrane protein [Bacteroidales bacterium]